MEMHLRSSGELMFINYGTVDFREQLEVLQLDIFSKAFEVDDNLIRDGDKITIDLINRTLNVNQSEEELYRRKISLNHSEQRLNRLLS